MVVWVVWSVHSDIKFPFSTYELVVEVAEYRWYVWMFQLRFNKQLFALCPYNMFLSFFGMNQRYGYLRYMKTLAIIRIKIVVSVFRSIGIFFSLRQVKKLVVSVVFTPSRDFLFLKHVLKAGEIEWIEYSWLVPQKIEEGKTDSMLWLDFNKVLKILIESKNM